MPEPQFTHTGAPRWMDLTTSDLDGSTAFYQDLFGWDFAPGDDEFGSYVRITKDGADLGGAMARTPEMGEGPDMWTVYLGTPDAAATTDAVTAAGGQVLVPPMPVGDLGTMAVYLDPGEAVVGAWQPDSFAGFGVLAETGAACWFELHTSHYAASLDFYRQAFGWDLHPMADTDEFRYATLGTGESQAAGIMDATVWLTDGAPASWSVYFGADDTDTTVARAEELGAKVVDPAQDTPYGRMATLADPTGAIFKLVQDPQD